MFGGATQSWAHHSDLVMYARRVLGDRSDTAEDIVQEAYLRLLGLAASDEAPSSARPWLFRVVRNLAIDERRGAARRGTPVAEVGALGAVAAVDTAALVEQREEISEAFRELAALPPRERRALEMDQAGAGAQEIASELGTTPNAVHQALFRARRRMRKARAVAWGLVPVALAPLLLRVSDPALAVTITNLPPGAPVGRALPVAGLVAVAMVGGSAVAPHVDSSPVDARKASVFVASAHAGPAATRTGTTTGAGTTIARSVSAGTGTRSEGHGTSTHTSGGTGDHSAGRSGSNRGSEGGDGPRHRQRTGGSTNGGDGRGDTPDTAGRHHRGATTDASKPAKTSDHAPDTPDAPDQSGGGLHTGGSTTTTN
jgi:RNA polymerase sigma factor (sigma-70 family)